MKQDWDTAEQSDMFDEFLADTSDSRSHTWTGAYGYDELEWEAFQYGWNAAKKHYGGCMNERIRQLIDGM